MTGRNLLLSALLVFVLPVVLFHLFLLGKFENEIRESNSVTETVKTDPLENTGIIRVIDQSVIYEIPLEEYVTGVVLGEMPAEFEEEALKAQAVASRTFTLRCVQRNSKHEMADVCTDPACCQTYIAADDYTGSESLLNKVSNAVHDTAGQVITFHGNLIEAVYFSCSGGRTEDAVAVWGTDIPYLQSVYSPGEEIAKNYESVTTLSRSDFLKKLGLESELPDAIDYLEITSTDGGGVESLTVGDKTYSGTQVRTLLNLKSTFFTVEISDDVVEITTKGYGHRVGLSQYGAEAMALAGSGYDEILLHYYTDVELQTLSQDQMDAIFDKAEII